MIPRYSRPDMVKIWSDQTRFEIWLEVETLALEKMADLGLAPKEAYEEVKKKGAFNTERVLEIEEEVKHDVIAFLTNVAEHVGPASRFVHRGMTSSDLLDTTLAVQLARSGSLLIRDIDMVLQAVRERAEEFKYTPCIGRSHGIHAEPTTFGIKLVSWYAELKRHRVRLEAALKDVSVGKISGAVGTYASVPPEVEAHVMNKLGLRPETVSSQI
ncbi:MAG: adenylosuccinate lyase, partial [Bdellovibrionales bacterium]|nr:adenylosuccinate lyase [Bdellovibrionales bacterium]